MCPYDLPLLLKLIVKLRLGQVVLQWACLPLLDGFRSDFDLPIGLFIHVLDLALDIAVILLEETIEILALDLLVVQARNLYYLLHPLILFIHLVLALFELPPDVLTDLQLLVEYLSFLLQLQFYFLNLFLPLSLYERQLGLQLQGLLLVPGVDGL